MHEGFVPTSWFTQNRSEVMVASHLCLHRGARLVDMDELRSCQAPDPEGRW